MKISWFVCGLSAWLWWRCTLLQSSQPQMLQLQNCPAIILPTSRAGETSAWAKSKKYSKHTSGGTKETRKETGGGVLTFEGDEDPGRSKWVAVHLVPESQTGQRQKGRDHPQPVQHHGEPRPSSTQRDFLQFVFNHTDTKKKHERRKCCLSFVLTKVFHNQSIFCVYQLHVTCQMSGSQGPHLWGDAVLRCKDYTQISGRVIKTDEPWQVRRQTFSDLYTLPFVTNYDNLMEKALLALLLLLCCSSPRIHSTFLLHDTTCVCCCSVIMASPNTSLHRLLQERKMEQLHCDCRNWKHNSYLLRKRIRKGATNEGSFEWSCWTMLWWPSIKCYVNESQTSGCQWFIYHSWTIRNTVELSFPPQLL